MPSNSSATELAQIQLLPVPAGPQRRRASVVRRRPQHVGRIIHDVRHAREALLQDVRDRPGWPGLALHVP